MGVPWLSQVRTLHLSIIILTAVSLVLYVAYVITPMSSLTLMSLELLNPVNNVSSSSEIGAIQTRNDTFAPAKGIGNRSTSVSSEGDPQARSQPDLTKGIPAKVIYESGHVRIPSKLCPDRGVGTQLLIMVTSAPSHESARMAIRQTWGHYATRRDVAVAFMLGSTPNDTLKNQIDREQYLYQDIIRGKFVDTYDNLTLKTISMLEWVDSNCPRAAFVLKTDDDMFINVPKLLTFISKHNPDQRAIYGRLAKKWKPIRNKKSKYYISPRQYKPSVFPDFTTGPAYLLPARLAKELYVAALTQPYFKLEDVFVTGIVADSLKIKRVLVPEFLNKRVSFTPCNVQKCISVHMVKGAEQYDLWKKLLDGLTKCK